MRGLGFAPATTDANQGASNAGNGMLDADEMALVAQILATPSLDLTKRGGVSFALVRAAWLQAHASATKDFTKLATAYPTSATVAAGYAMLGRASFAAYNDMAATFGAPMAGDYTLALALARYLAVDGDADGDGVNNLTEYRAHQSAGRAAYLRAALDPTIATRVASAAPSTAPRAATPVAASTKKTLGVVLYPGFEVLDVFGPVEMWAYVREFNVVMISQKAGPVKSAQGVSTVADYSFETAPPLDIMMVPGGTGTLTELQNPALLDYLRAQHQRTEFTTSVCTGSALLAKAGILKGHKATSNKTFFSLAVDQDPDVEWIPKARWVEDGKLLTSSGVSAGTDMALGLVAKLYGKARAQQLARSLEYTWNDDAFNDPFAIPAVPKPTKR
ncbi:MAG: DJ-1/PfpI family protein [Gemmatimonadaceae bacterium]|nr:DJ-1/PfpI family protein [Gemmatimonadaceae bacterium]